MQILFAALRQVIALLQQNPALVLLVTDPWSGSPPLIRRIALATSLVARRVGACGSREAACTDEVLTAARRAAALFCSPLRPDQEGAKSSRDVRVSGWEATREKLRAQ